MQFFGRVLTGVSDIYSSINPSNLSGSIDVLVIHDPDTDTLRCTPFHVRFGKLQLLIKPQDRKVDISVNGVHIPEIEMRIGEAGEAYFVEPLEEGDQQIPSRFLSTSPSDVISSPILQARSDRALSDTEEQPTAQSLPTTATAALREPQSDSEINYSMGKEPSSTIDTKVDTKNLPSPTPSWDWQWGDLPVHRKVTANNSDEQMEEEGLQVFSCAYDFVSFLQTVRNIERVVKHLVLGMEIDLFLIKAPFQIYTIRDLSKNLDEVFLDNIDKPLSYQEFEKDLAKLLEPEIVAKLVVRFSGISKTWYLAGRVGIHAAITMSIFGQMPSLTTLLKLAEESLEEEPPKETVVPVRTWRSWWTRSATSPTTPTQTAVTSSLASPTSPILIPTLPPESPIKEHPQASACGKTYLS